MYLCIPIDRFSPLPTPPHKTAYTEKVWKGWNWFGKQCMQSEAKLSKEQPKPSGSFVYSHRYFSSAHIQGICYSLSLSFTQIAIALSLPPHTISCGLGSVGFLKKFEKFWKYFFYFSFYWYKKIEFLFFYLTRKFQNKIFLVTFFIKRTSFLKN